MSASNSPYPRRNRIEQRSNSNNRFRGQSRSLSNNANDLQIALQLSLQEASLHNHSSTPLPNVNDNNLNFLDNAEIVNNHPNNNYYMMVNDIPNANENGEFNIPNEQKIDIHNFDNNYQRAIQESLLERNSMPKELSLEDVLEMSKKEAEINQQIHDEIYNRKGLLRSILCKLNRVNPNDAIFAEFYNNQNEG